MGITIREPGEGDFFSWLALYEDYAGYNGRQLTDQGALVVWSWLAEPAHSERGFVAVADDGALIGLVHFHDVPRPLDGMHALQIDDLFVLEEHREHGYGRALIEAVSTLATASGISIVEWTAAHNDADSRRFYDEFADFTEEVVYRLRPVDAAGAGDDADAAPPDETAPPEQNSEFVETAEHPDGIDESQPGRAHPEDEPSGLPEAEGAGTESVRTEAAENVDAAAQPQEARPQEGQAHEDQGHEDQGHEDAVQPPTGPEVEGSDAEGSDAEQIQES